MDTGMVNPQCGGDFRVWPPDCPGENWTFPSVCVRYDTKHMSEWYYSKDGAQLGPVSETELRKLLAAGSLDPQRDLVWKSGMADWLPAAKVPTFAEPSAVAADPYAAPASGIAAEEHAGGASAAGLAPIAPGSEKFDALACVKRGFDLAVRHLGLVLLAMVVWIGVSIAAEIVLSIMDAAMGWGTQAANDGDGDGFSFTASSSPLNMLISHVFSVFLTLGFVRFMLNVASGREASVAQLFGEGRLLLRGLIASLLFGVMVGVGFLLLIIPGIYLVARYGFFMNALVDRNCGILESFRISSELTTNNRLNVVLLMFASLIVVILGFLAMCVGVLFAYPVVALAWAVAYRWMEFGHRAAMDHPGTTTPMLTPTTIS
jgi:hypothetical protein